MWLAAFRAGDRTESAANREKILRRDSPFYRYAVFIGQSA